MSDLLVHYSHIKVFVVATLHNHQCDTSRVYNYHENSTMKDTSHPTETKLKGF